MLIYHPDETQHFQQRNALLQKCLRPEPLPFGIEEEYPIVLAAEGREFSYCQDHLGGLCSHANLWPRRVIDSRNQEIFKLGLVGNVATDPNLRGHGYMRSLLSEIEKKAAEKDLGALMLWSDLSSFYHKLGYRAVGREFRLRFRAASPRKCSREEEFVFFNKPTLELGMKSLEGLSQLRLPGAVALERRTDEFVRLLSIPWLEVFALKRSGQLVAYALVGKGYDMAGVVHEWGAQEPGDLEGLLTHVCGVFETEEILVLAPSSLPASWLAKSPREEVPMALARILDPKIEKELDELFIWGLDSI